MSSDHNLLARNTFMLMVSEVLTRFLGALLTVLIARRLGADNLGLLSFAVSFTELFGVVIRFGFKNLVSRDVSKHPEKAGRYLGGILTLQAGLSVILLTVLAVVSLAFGFPGLKTGVVLLTAVVLAVGAVLDVLYAFFRAFQRTGYEGLNKVGLNLAVSLSGIALVWTGHGLVEMMAVRALCYGVFLFSGYRLVVRHFARPEPDRSLKSLTGLLRASLPFASLVIVVSVNTQMGTVLLSFLKGDAVTGVYSGALRICGVLGFFPLAFVGAVMPAMSRYHEAGETERWRTRYGQTLRYLFILVAPMAVVFTLFSARTIGLLYGPSFGASAPILQVLSWMLVFAFLNHGTMIALSSMDREKTFVLIQIAGTALNLVAAVPLILKWEGLGLAVAALAGQAFIFTAGAVRLSRWVSVRFALAALWKPLVSALLLALVLWELRGLPFAALLGISAAGYPALLFLLRTFSPKEIRALRDLARPNQFSTEDAGHAPLVD